MKAYKYHRSVSATIRISLQSNGVSEDIIYIPDLKKIIYSGYSSWNQESYFGVVDDEKMYNLIVQEVKGYLENPYDFSEEREEEKRDEVKAQHEKEKAQRQKENPGSILMMSPVETNHVNITNFEEIDADFSLEGIESISIAKAQIKESEQHLADLKQVYFNGSK